jgi:putative phosphoribosyl transferase
VEQNEMAEEPIFRDRREAGRELARRLQKYAGRQDLLVLGIPRGGVPVAFEVASALKAPLDIFVSRKLGVPGQEELAFGAVASGGTRILDNQIVNAVGLSELDIEHIAARENQELQRREQVFRDGRPPLDVEGKIVVLVDDGIATGASTRVAIAALRQMRPAEIVVAAPVVPLWTYERLRREADDVIGVHTPKSFFAIGEFYDDFSQATDEEVMELLRQASSKDRKDPRAAPPHKVDGEVRT